jgi:ribosomal biogenesis protein LAS1
MLTVYVRFVTGLVDTKLGVQRGTMFSRASMIGLPLSFVELRHEAAHRELPSLVLLRNYTNRALEWLWGYYWAKIDSPFVRHGAGTGEDDLRIRIKHVLQQQQPPDSSAGPKKSRSTHLPLAQSLSSICKNSPEGAQVLSRVLLDDDFLIPKDRQ